MAREGVHTLRAHCIRYLNNFSGKWSTFEALVNTVLWWRLLGEESWQGVGPAPLGELTCNQCSNRLKHGKSLHTNPGVACGYTAQVPSAVSGTVLGKSTGAHSRQPLNWLKWAPQQPQLEDTFARRVQHPNECSGHLSQCCTPKHHPLL